MLQVYGIKNCNTVKKSLDWLKQKNISFIFLDVKKGILEKSLLENWMINMPNYYSWDKLINKSGVTWRKLTYQNKELALTSKATIELILLKPTVMKRPVITQNKKIITIGFDESEFIEKIK